MGPHPLKDKQKSVEAITEGNLRQVCPPPCIFIPSSVKQQQQPKNQKKPEQTKNHKHKTDVL